MTPRRPKPPLPLVPGYRVRNSVRRRHSSTHTQHRAPTTMIASPRLTPASAALGGGAQTPHAAMATSFAGAASKNQNNRASFSLPSSCFAATALSGGSVAGAGSPLTLASVDEKGGVLERAHAISMGSRGAAAGGLAGIIARTASAPLDRIKLLFQVGLALSVFITFQFSPRHRG